MVSLNRYIYDPTMDAQCFFRSTSKFRKAIIKITEKCNMKCKHCFNDSTNRGTEMNLDFYLKVVLPFLTINKFDRVTFTGGEPTLNKALYQMIEHTLNANLKVTLCTNGLKVNIEEIKKIHSENFKLNISLDGFTETSYGSFRGVNTRGFQTVKSKIEELAKLKCVKGILVTPNSFSTVDEYVNLVEWGKAIKVDYILFNKFAELGRGEKNIYSFEVDDIFLNELRKRTTSYINPNFEILYVRFPPIYNKRNKCFPYQFHYIDCNGDITICPYISFAVGKLLKVGNVSSINDYQEELMSFEMGCGVERETETCQCDLVMEGGAYFGKTNCN